jgi:lipoyl-dependent peroxiredoxin subunit D
MMTTLEELRTSLPEVANDIKLNLQSVLGAGVLSAGQRFGVAVAAAIASRNPALQGAVLQEARSQVDAKVIEDAQAAAVLMAMNNIYYRFRHMIGKESYVQTPARLRMNRIARPATSKADFELFSLAVSAINGCEACVRAHEKSVLEAGLTEDHVQEAVRIAATIHAAAVALELDVA